MKPDSYLLSSFKIGIIIFIPIAIIISLFPPFNWDIPANRKVHHYNAIEDLLPLKKYSLIFDFNKKHFIWGEYTFQNEYYDKDSVKVKNVLSDAINYNIIKTGIDSFFSYDLFKFKLYKKHVVAKSKVGKIKIYEATWEDYGGITPPEIVPQTDWLQRRIAGEPEVPFLKQTRGENPLGITGDTRKYNYKQLKDVQLTTSQQHKTETFSERQKGGITPIQEMSKLDKILKKQRKKWIYSWEDFGGITPQPIQERRRVWTLEDVGVITPQPEKKYWTPENFGGYTPQTDITNAENYSEIKNEYLQNPKLWEVKYQKSFDSTKAFSLYDIVKPHYYLLERELLFSELFVNFLLAFFLSIGLGLLFVKVKERKRN